MAETKPKPTQSNPKTKKELEAEQAAAKEQIQALLDSSRPKHIGYGVASGVSNILTGAVGGVGVIVLAPTLGMTAGAKHGGIIGGTVGLLGGAVVGAIGGAAMVVGGAVQGLTQVVRGAVATPDAVIEPRRGKWWNDIEGKWILTNLDVERKAILDVPEDDDDILGDAKKEAEAGTKPPDAHTASKVVNMDYYNALEINPDAESAKIKRQYYILARKYHPDKIGKEDKEAAEKFKEISEAYQVLSDPKLRYTYDTEGKDALSADRTGLIDGATKIDPALLFAFLFGSDKFGDYLGRLAMATSALVADSPKIGQKEARNLQKRRVTRLALKLVDRLKIWTEDDRESAVAITESTVTDLSKASYGTELVHLIGKIYSLSAHQFLGSIDSGVGMPSIAKWAKGHHAKMEQSSNKSKANLDGLKAGVKMMALQQKAAQDIALAKTDEEKIAVKEKLEEDMTKGMMSVMWTTTVVDITSTLHEVVQMVLFDQSVDSDTRKCRARDLQSVGEIFMACPATSDICQPEDARQMYQEAAFAAMLETIKRKEEEAQAAQTH